MAKPKIGIFAGAFDPIHAGHIAFALRAIKIAKLDRVYFLPERRPRYKPEVEHFGHRTAMIARAIRPHAKLLLLELPDIHFNVQKTLPKLRKEFAGAELVMLMGSDATLTLRDWPDIEKLLSSCQLAIGLRTGQSAAEVTTDLELLPSHPRYQLIATPAAEVSSGMIRRALRRNTPTAGLLTSVARYAQAQWLYISVTK